MKLLISRALGRSARASLAAVGCGEKHAPGAGTGGVTAGRDEGDDARTTGSGCGRPFFVGGHVRAATFRVGTAWIGERIPTLDELDPTTRAELARAWLRDAQLEHASIAAFARFTLHALSFGAPADLIADSQRAGLDEVRHAQLCFALACRYGGEAIGPGTLSMHGVLAHQSLADVAEATVREGCVAETIAAYQVRRQLELSRDPHVRDALEVIAEDELRHAELAWRFVHWAIDAGGRRAQSAVERAFHDALARVGDDSPADSLAVDATTWHDHGRLTPLEEYACWKDAVRDVIEPCAGALLERGGLFS